jgi:hypothetical protein
LLVEEGWRLMRVNGCVLPMLGSIHWPEMALNLRCSTPPGADQWGKTVAMQRSVDVYRGKLPGSSTLTGGRAADNLANPASAPILT